MPYRKDPKNPNCVQVQKNGKWKRLKCYSGKNARKQCTAYLAALKINTKYDK